MKKTLIAATLMMCAGSAFADSTAVLQVNGKLTNASCTPELSNGGVVDYGYVRLGTLSASSNNDLGTKDFDLTIKCSVATKVAWFINDDHADDNANISINVGGNSAKGVTYTYGIGKTKDGVNIGSYAITPSGVNADGSAGQYIIRNSDWSSTLPWSSTGSIIRPQGITISSVAKQGDIVPLAFNTAVFNLQTSLSIKDTTTLAITDDTEMNGQATITLQYL